MTSEDPLEDVWSLLGLYGSEEFLRENVTEVKDIEALADYVAVRIRQANELREAWRETTLLTAPLSLYLLEPSGGCKLKVEMDKEPDSLDGVASDARNQSDSQYDANMVRC
jgi:hypothetical protein